MIQVKGGHVTVSQVRDFAHVIEREKATMGLFLSSEPPTKPMLQEADSFGFYTTPLGGHRLPRLQLYTVGGLLSGEPLKIPSSAAGIHWGVTQAKRLKVADGQQALNW